MALPRRLGHDLRYQQCWALLRRHTVDAVVCASRIVFFRGWNFRSLPCGEGIGDMFELQGSIMSSCP
jgi:hypothetical protein